MKLGDAENIIGVSKMAASPTGSLRDNKGKPPIHWVPFFVIECAAKVLWKSSIPGGGKYPAGNWKKGNHHSVPLASLMRHAGKRADGQMNDEESGMPHSWHILINAIFLVYYEKYHAELNDLLPEEK